MTFEADQRNLLAKFIYAYNVPPQRGSLVLQIFGALTKKRAKVMVSFLVRVVFLEKVRLEH